MQKIPERRETHDPFFIVENGQALTPHGIHRYWPVLGKRQASGKIVAAQTTAYLGYVESQKR